MQIPYNREGSLDGTDPEISSPSFQASHNTENRHPNCLRSQSVVLRHNRPMKLTNPVQDLFHRVRSMNFDRNVGNVMTSQDSIGGLSSPASRSDAEVSSDECTTGRSTSQGSLSSCSSRGVIDVAMIPLIRTEGVSTLPPSKEDLQSSPPSVLVHSICLPT